jgi:hypothetical protein
MIASIANAPIFRMTAHVRQRYYERVIAQEWRGICHHEKELWALFKRCQENKSWVNNEDFVDFLKAKYGNCKVKIFKDKTTGLVFICRRHETIVNLFFVTTCFYPKAGTIFSIEK